MGLVSRVAAALVSIASSQARLVQIAQDDAAATARYNETLETFQHAVVQANQQIAWLQQEASVQRGLIRSLEAKVRQVSVFQ